MSIFADLVVSDHKAEYISSILTGNKPRLLISATLSNSGGTLHVSRYENEPGYFIDAFFSNKGVPVFVHGKGGRGCLKRALTETANAKLIDGEAHLTLPKPTGARI